MAHAIDPLAVLTKTGPVPVSLWFCLMLGACAPSSQLTKPSAATDAQRVEQAIDLIETKYFAEVSRSSLNAACLASMKESPPTSGGADASKLAINEALRRRRAQDPEQELNPGSEECIRGIVGTLKGDSRYIDARELREMQNDAPPVAGIGIELAKADSGVHVLNMIQGAAAERAGLVQGDILIQIDDQVLDGLSLTEIVPLLRGAPGSRVRITVRDPESEVLRTVTLEREVIRLESVTTRLLEPGIVLLRVTRFDRAVPQRIADGLADARMASGGALTGIVLDLRGSDGGLLNVTVAIAAAFLPRAALVVSLVARAPDAPPKLYAAPEYYVSSRQSDPYAKLVGEAKTARMVVLISKITGAGAEAVAAALQDHKRATVVGTNTLGKGLVETVLPLSRGGALVLTTGSMFRPSDAPLHDVGVTPDVMTRQAPGQLSRMAAVSPTDPGLKEAVDILKSR